MMPIRDVVIFPHMMTPFVVGRESSVRALEEALAGDRKGQYSIRINDQFRVCFVWTPEGPAEVEIVDYH